MLMLTIGCIVTALIVGLIIYNGIVQARQHKVNVSRDEAMQYLGRIRKYQDLIDAIPAAYMPVGGYVALLGDMLKLAEVAHQKVPADATIKRKLNELKEEKAQAEQGIMNKDSKRCSSLSDAETVHNLLKRLLTLLQLQTKEGALPMAKFQEIHKELEENFIQASLDGELSLMDMYQATDKFQSALYHANRVKELYAKHNTNDRYTADLKDMEQRIKHLEVALGDQDTTINEKHMSKASREWDEFMDEEGIKNPDDL